MGNESGRIAMRAARVCTSLLAAGFFVAAGVPGSGPPGLLGASVASAQPQEEEPEDTGPRSPTLRGKGHVLQPDARNRAAQPRRTPDVDADVRVRDHRSEPRKGTLRGGRVIQQDEEPDVAYATSSIQCGDTVYEVSTGNDQGACDTDTSGGKPSGIRCRDGEGNNAYASCSSGCKSTEGSGSCKIKQAE